MGSCWEQLPRLPCRVVLVSVFFKRHDPQSVDLLLPLLTHGAIWSAVGAIGGLAFGLGLGGQGRWKATMMGGLLGAAAATVVYEMVGALLLCFQQDRLASVILDYDTSSGSVAGRHPLGIRRGLGLETICAEKNLLVRALMRT